MVGQNEAAKAVYSDKFNKMMMKTAGKMQYWMFKNDQDRYILFMKLPSESIDRLTYDVAIDFYTRDIVQKKLNRLTGYYVRFFSNDPNFTFTYANVFHKNKLIIPELESKLSPESLREKPKVSNPSGTVGYVKSIYFAYLFIKMKGLDNKLAWLNAPKITTAALTEITMTANKKIAQSQELKKIQSATKNGSMVIGSDDLDHLKVRSNQATTTVKSIRKTQKVARANVIRGNNHKVSTVKRIGRH